MTSFLDGPAKDAVLALHRAPRYLRVVISPAGKVDALDQPDDVPKPRETIYVYSVVGTPTPVHLNMGSTRRGSGFYMMGTYEHVPDVDGETVRDRDDWRAWCIARREAEPA